MSCPHSNPGDVPPSTALNLIESDPSLIRIAQYPLMLSMVLRCLPELMHRSQAWPSHDSLSIREVYELFFKRWIESQQLIEVDLVHSFARDAARIMLLLENNYLVCV